MEKSEDKIFQDVQTIRNILFGEQHEELVQRIKVLETEVKTLQKQNAELHQRLEAEAKARTGDAKKAAEAAALEQKAVLSRLTSIIKDFQTQSETSHQELSTDWKSGKKYLSQRISHVRKELMDRMDAEKLKQSELIEMLAKALSGYQEVSHTNSKNQG